MLPSLVRAALRTSEWAMKRYATRIAQRHNAQQRASSPVPARAAGATKRHGLRTAARPRTTASRPSAGTKLHAPHRIHCEKVHLMDQPELAKGDGPIALMISPTRELTEQIYQMAKKCALAAAARRSAVQCSAARRNGQP